MFQTALPLFSFLLKSFVAVYHTRLIADYGAEIGLLWLSQWQNAIAIGLILADEGLHKYLIRSENLQEKSAGWGSLVLYQATIASFCLGVFFVLSRESSLKFYYLTTVWLSFFSILLFQSQQSFLLRHNKKIAHATQQIMVSCLIFILVNIFPKHILLLHGLWLPYFFVFVGSLFYQKIDWKNLFFDKSALLKMSSYGLVALTIGATDKMAVMFLRENVEIKFGIYEAGQWQAIQSFSAYYWAFLLFVFSNLLYPDYCHFLKKEMSPKSLKRKIFFYLSLIFACFLGLLFFGKAIFVLIFGQKFNLFSDMLNWVCLGDFLRALGLMVSYFILAQGTLRLFMILQSVNFVFWALIFYFALQTNDIQTLFYAQALTGLMTFFLHLMKLLKLIKQ